MTAARWIGCVLGLVVAAGASTAHADGVADDLGERLRGCEGLPDRAQVRFETVGETALHAVAKSGERYLVFPADEGRTCAVYAIGRAAARAAGRFGAASKAFALRPAQCGGGPCAVALAVRGNAERPTAAVLAGVDCDVDVALRPIKLFRDRDSIELVCHQSTGAGWREDRVVFDAAAGGLAQIYRLGTGSYIPPTPDERKAGACPHRPVGSLRVEKVGDKPVLRVVDPESGELHDGKGTLPARQLIFDPAAKSFAPSGAADIPTKVDAQAPCKH